MSCWGPTRAGQWGGLARALSTPSPLAWASCLGSLPGLLASYPATRSRGSARRGHLRYYVAVGSSHERWCGSEDTEPAWVTRQVYLKNMESRGVAVESRGTGAKAAHRGGVGRSQQAEASQAAADALISFFFLFFFFSRSAPRQRVSRAGRRAGQPGGRRRQRSVCGGRQEGVGASQACAPSGDEATRRDRRGKFAAWPG